MFKGNVIKCSEDFIRMSLAACVGAAVLWESRGTSILSDIRVAVDKNDCQGSLSRKFSGGFFSSSFSFSSCLFQKVHKHVEVFLSRTTKSLSEKYVHCVTW